MLKESFRLFKKYPIYFFVVLAGLLSSIGSGLTQLVVYGALQKMNVQPSVYTFAFALTVLPGLISSQLGNSLVHRLKWSTVVISMELLGAALVVIPYFGLKTQNITLLLLTEFFSSLLVGFSIPVINVFIKNFFQDKELPGVTAISSYSFSTNVLLGYGLGALLFNRVNSETYLLIDFTSFILSALVFYITVKICPSLDQKKDNDKNEVAKFFIKTNFKNFSTTQKRAFWLLPMLTFVAAPLTALLPSFGAQFGAEVNLMGIILLTPSVALIFAKTFGQMLGPMLINPKKIDQNFSNTTLIVISLLIYLLCYTFVIFSENFLISLTVIVLAHIASNIVYILAQYSLLRHFSSKEIALTTTNQYQVQVSLIVISSLLSGYLSDHFGAKSVLLLSFINLILCMPWLMKHTIQDKTVGVYCDEK